MRNLWTLLLAGLLITGGCAATSAGGMRIGGSVGDRAPEFQGDKADWLNSPPLSLAEIIRTHARPDGTPVRAILVDFWEYTCVNCVRTFPYLTEWNRRYAKDGLLIVGIHTPEFQFAADRANVAAAVKRFGLTYPILIDSAYRNWNAYGNQYWPHHYLLDASGRIVHDHVGEGGYGETERQIQALLKKGDPSLKLPPLMALVRDTDKPGAVCYPVTPEVYAGYARGSLSNPSGYAPDRVASYTDTGRAIDGRPLLRGRWRATPEALIHEGDDPSDFAALAYHALDLFAVLRPENGSPVRVDVTQDGRPVDRTDKGDDLKYDASGRSYVIVDAPRMYSLVHNARYGSHVVRLAPQPGGFGLYSFTFGSCTVE